MDITVTHRPLTLEEAVPIVECFRKIAGIPWCAWFYAVVFAFLGGIMAWKTMSLTLLILIVAVFAAFIVPSFFSRRNRVAANNSVLRSLSQSPLYPLVHRIRLTDAGLNAEVPGFAVSARWDGVSGYFLCPSPALNDELLLLLMPGYPILRKSDFDSEADFHELLNLLQRQSLQGREDS